MDRSQLITFPHDDREFQASAERLIQDGADTPAKLQSELRRAYPRARVIEGISDTALVPRWYVYRDGSLVGGTP